MISKSLKIVKQQAMDRGNSRENEGMQRRIVAKLHVF